MAISMGNIWENDDDPVDFCRQTHMNHIKSFKISTYEGFSPKYPKYDMITVTTIICCTYSDSLLSFGLVYG